MEKPASKSKRKPKETSDDVDADVLPEKGLHNSDGFLFYHASFRPLTSAQHRRAEEHGIDLKTKKVFTVEESIQVFENWRKFATEHNMKLAKAPEYISPKKTDRHIFKHQEEHHFWPKLCDGLPHRPACTIKMRAISMMTSSFMENLEWSRLAEEIKAKLHTYETNDDLTMQKAQKLLEKGYAASHVAEILNVSNGKMSSMASKLRTLEARNDPTMIHAFYESTVYFGLKLKKLRRAITTNDDYRIESVRRKVRLEEIGLQLHISEQKCKDLLKIVIETIRTKYTESLEEAGLDEDEAWSKALALVDSRPPIEESQLYKALEIICKHIEKAETTGSLLSHEQLPSIIKSHGITGFQSDRSEYAYLHFRLCGLLMHQLTTGFFEHLRREFPLQIKLHCLLWSYKRLDVWEKICVEEGKTRYETVLKSEIANPLASKMTLKFLKNEKVVEWISDPRPPKNRQKAATRRLETAIESFILYSYNKFGETFKFPAKFRRILHTSKTVRSVLEVVSDPENAEFLSIKEARKTVEDASGCKIAVKIKNKRIVPKLKDESDASEDGESENSDSEDLIKHSHSIERSAFEERRDEIEKVLQRADPSKIRAKFRKKDEIPEEILLSKELRQQKRAMTRAAEKLERLEAKICSAEFIDDGSGCSYSQVDEDLLEREKKRKRKKSEASEVVIGTDQLDTAEDLQGSKKKKHAEVLEGKDHEDTGCSDSQQVMDPEVCEDLVEKEKKKKRKRKISEASEVVIGMNQMERAEDLQRSKKKKHAEILEGNDHEDSENLKKRSKKKKKRKDHDAEFDAELDLDSENLDEEPKKRKKHC
ncbi:Fanconi-associated nuclease [Caenorhabditis elegans]|uniref:Fanconi-associated nuclease n=4 Tax=Caenorhabditis elegans TaxID=6239 RepID=G4S703_CAEEL|nr:Fanconi-associated nuclease [Caenorhabditis elegans]CCD67099.1 Fanconi-associated nuclease [Caenorhabditis elegans]|eukprot:NP_001041196.1 Uncharacterized protein CELE_Y50D4A.1 [Caenorhabditis elegans]